MVIIIILKSKDGGHQHLQSNLEDIKSSSHPDMTELQGSNGR